MRTLRIALLGVTITAPLWAQTQAPAVPDSTKLEVIKSRTANYPVKAQLDGIQGQVWLKFDVSENGDVTKIETISGDPILAESAADALKKWKFKPFIRDGKPVKVTTKLPFDFFFNGKVFEKGKSVDGTSVASPQPAAATADAASPANPATGNPADTPTRVRVSQGVSQGLLIRQIAPVYPAVARMNRIQGAVVLKAIIDKEGRIRDLQPMQGPPELIPAAIGAVQQWRYKPYYLKGEPVEVETHITVNFALR